MVEDSGQWLAINQFSIFNFQFSIDMAFIIDDILLSPIKFPIWLAKKLRESAYQELTDESSVHEALLNLQMRYEVGEVSEETYEKEEAKLMERLEAIRKMKEEEI